MYEQHTKRWLITGAIGAVSLGFLFGVGAMRWLTPRPPLAPHQAGTDAPYDHRFAKFEQSMTALTQALHARQGTLEHAVTELTQALHASQAHTPPSEPTRGTAPAPTTASSQGLAQLIRTEIRQAMTHESPENRRVRAEAEVVAQVLATPENRAAYASAAHVVAEAVASRRWTEEDKVAFRAAFVQLTNAQRTELMSTLAPAINRGEIEVEVHGPLF